MPLTPKGEEIMENMEKTYKSPEKAKEVFYASPNKGTIKGVHDVEAPKPASGPMSTKGPSDGNVNNLPDTIRKDDYKGLDCGREMSLDAIKSTGKRIGRY